MKKSEIIAIFDELINLKVINISQIPDIDLYMDQVTTFVEDRLSPYKRNEEDKLLTKTMINNYTKEGLLAPPVKKKYSREHIIRLIMIYHLKATLSIADIGTLMKAIPQERSLEAYDCFVNLQEAEKTLTPEGLKKSFDGIELHSEADKEAIVNTILMLVLEANCRRQLAERLIDRYLSKDGVFNKEASDEQGNE
jgi:DNA-binding transcriptional MerR regulator